MSEREKIVRCHCGAPMYEWDIFYQNVGECQVCHFLGGMHYCPFMEIHCEHELSPWNEECKKCTATE